MTIKTIKQLNQLNKNFYKTTAQSFSDSRNSAWEGWEKLAAYIKDLSKKNKKINVLDLACGNGRFADFLSKNFSKSNLNYLGVDNSDKLLKIAKEKYQHEFEKLDLLELLIANKLDEKFKNKKFNLITAFGLMHHLPSFKLRKKFLKDCCSLLAADGLLVVTFWQFHKSERLMRKVVDPNQVNIKQEDLEKNDYILDWQRGQTAHRYCHSFEDKEIKQLCQLNNLEVLDEFNADGKEKLNKYLVLRKH